MMTVRNVIPETAWRIARSAIYSRSNFATASYMRGNQPGSVAISS